MAALQPRMLEGSGAGDSPPYAANQKEGYFARVHPLNFAGLEEAARAARGDGIERLG